MWAARDQRYGGLNTRYKTYRGGLVRMLSPFTGQPLEFSSTLKADNWLLRAFCPGAVECLGRVSGFNILEGGKVKPPVIHTLTTFKDRIRIADLVVTERTPKVESRWEVLQKAGSVYRFTPCLRTREEIRANPVLLENLDTMRQHLVQHGGYFLIAADDVLRSLHRGASTRRELAKDLARRPHSSEEIDTVLFSLYRQDRIAINIAEVPYGIDTKLTIKDPKG
jgi:hypothetical protein